MIYLLLFILLTLMILPLAVKNSYERSSVVQYAVFLMFGLGIGPLLSHYGLELMILGLRIESWIWLIIMGLLLIGLMKKDTFSATVNFVWRTSFRYYFFYLVILFFGLFQTPYLTEGLGLFLTKVFPFVVLIHFFCSNLRLGNLFKLVTFALIVNILLLIVYLLLGNSPVNKDYTGTLRLTGTMGWASFAYFLLVILGISIVKFMEKFKMRYLYVVLVLLVLVTSTISRTALLISVLICLSIFFTLKRGKLTVFIFFIGLCLLLSPIFYDLFYDRFFHTASSVGISTSGRSTAVLYLFDQYITDFSSVLFGSGTGVARSSLEELSEFGIKRVHSAVAETFFDNGLLGALALLFFAIKVFYRGFRHLKKVKVEFSYQHNENVVFISSLLTGMIGAVMFTVLIFFENMYDPYLSAILLVMIFFSEVNVYLLKPKGQKEIDSSLEFSS